MEKYIKKIKNIPKRIEREIEAVRYKKGRYAGKLNILDAEETLAYIEKNPVSFYRYGDGEIAIMKGEGIAFQKADDRLARKLIELLSVKEQGIMAAIPHCYFNYEHGMTDILEQFNYAMKTQRRFLLEHCRRDTVYLDTTITQMYQSYEAYNFELYFDRVKKLFQGKKVTLVCGKGIFKNIKYSLFDESNDITYIEAPNKNAFSEYDAVLKQALTVPKDALVCIVLGPTAKPLAYDLHKNGYQAWDIGHLIKDYDAYCRKASRDMASVAEFYRPD